MNDLWSRIVDAWLHSSPGTSPGGKLDSVDWVRILVNTSKVAASAAAASGLAYFGTQALNIDWGTLTAIMTPILHFVLDALTKKLTDNTVPVKKLR